MPISGKPEISAHNPRTMVGLRRWRPICRTKSWELTLFSADLGLGKLLSNL
jgi:hypothetical protein